MKAEIDDFDKEILNKTAEGRAYLKYNEKVGGEPWGNGIGIPYYGEKYKTLVEMYDNLTERGITWEEALGYQRPTGDASSVVI